MEETEDEGQRSGGMITDVEVDMEMRRSENLGSAEQRFILAF